MRSLRCVMDDKIITTWDKVVDKEDKIRRWAVVTAKLLSRNIRTFAHANRHYPGYAPKIVERIINYINYIKANHLSH